MRHPQLMKGNKVKVIRIKRKVKLCVIGITIVGDTTGVKTKAQR